MTKKGRRSNSASPDDLVKVFRSHLPAGLDKKYLEHDPEQIVAWPTMKKSLVTFFYELQGQRKASFPRLLPGLGRM